MSSCKGNLVPSFAETDSCGYRMALQTLPWLTVSGYGAHIKSTPTQLIIQRKGEVRNYPLRSVHHLVIAGGHTIHTSVITNILKAGGAISFLDQDSTPIGFLHPPLRHPDEEIRALQGRVRMDDVPTLSTAEKAALRYVECMCRTPLQFTSEAVADVKRHFSPRGFVILTSTCAQVNFWTRLIQSLGVPPAGFTAECSVLDLDFYQTLKR